MSALKRLAVRVLTLWQLWFEYDFRKVGKSPRLGRSLFVLKGCVTVGDYCYIGPFCYLDGDITLGNFVMLAGSVAMVGGDHRVDEPTVPMRFAGREPLLPVVVEDDVWIGHGAIIMHGVRIGEGSIVGAGSIVTRDVPANSIVVGSPAAVLRQRFEGIELERHAAALESFRKGQKIDVAGWERNHASSIGAVLAMARKRS